MSNSNETTNGRLLFIKWILLNMIGMGVAYSFAGLFTLPGNEASYFAAITIMGFLMGAVIGLFQWLVLRRWLKTPTLWAVVTGLGFAVAAHVSIPIILWDMYYNLVVCWIKNA